MPFLVKCRINFVRERLGSNEAEIFPKFQNFPSLDVSHEAFLRKFGNETRYPFPKSSFQSLEITPEHAL